jgi:hypothetical protein
MNNFPELPQHLGDILEQDSELRLLYAMVVDKYTTPGLICLSPIYVFRLCRSMVYDYSYIVDLNGTDDETENQCCLDFHDAWLRDMRK